MCLNCIPSSRLNYVLSGPQTFVKLRHGGKCMTLGGRMLLDRGPKGGCIVILMLVCIPIQHLFRIVTRCSGYALRMAIDHQVLSVIPPLFYELAEYFGVGSMVEGRETCCGDLAALNANELRTLLLGSATLRAHISSSFPSDIAEVDNIYVDLADCSASPPCREQDLKTFWTDLSEHIREGESPWTVLEDNGMLSDYVLCVHCRDAIETRLRNYREDLWSRLPQLFKLVSRTSLTIRCQELICMVGRI